MSRNEKHMQCVIWRHCWQARNRRETQLKLKLNLLIFFAVSWSRKNTRKHTHTHSPHICVIRHEKWKPLYTTRLTYMTWNITCNKHCLCEVLIVLILFRLCQKSWFTHTSFFVVLSYTSPEYLEYCIYTFWICWHVSLSPSSSPLRGGEVKALLTSTT